MTRGDRDRRRDEIPRIAIEVSAARGHDKASLAEISDRVGLTRAGALRHFPCEADPLTGVLDLPDATASPTIRRLIGADPSGHEEVEER
ncbi:hypothetical protein [Nocardiopsis lambiniae]|uniref:TetR family transcriptional regulator n=1 Tax=Nocardiopsis lambiniae TaxID=3075539 RepID=A0ABU2MHT5_9ACTN|nr:hypothetical protein [Nocardiopsis sp. DSM 44743]MDT0332143.1 hypothetical protein [Nocardiopsis sp. DSM 44743]